MNGIIRRSVCEVACLCCLAVAQSACSFTTLKRPSFEPPTSLPVECTTSPAAPILDTFLAPAAVLAAVEGSKALGEKNRDWGSAVLIAVGGSVTGVVAGILFGTSAIFGYRQTAVCRADEAHLMTKLAARPSDGSTSPETLLAR